MRSDELARLARTVARLRPAQAAQRVRLRTQRMALDHQVPLARRWLLSGVMTGAKPGAGWPGWPAGFAPLDARVWRCWPGGAALRGGEMRLLGVTRPLAPADEQGMARWAEADWAMAAAPLLWRFHLYYWDWAWALASWERPAQARAMFAALWSSWRAAVPPGTGPAWHPYPAALRAWSFCGVYGVLVAGGPCAEPFRADLAVHAGFLRRSLETDVGGNHLVKNLKGLAGLAVFAADDALLAFALRRLHRQLAVQVLPDGGHYERAPAYHCQVLGDLTDIAGLLRAAGRPEPAGLRDAIDAMRGWLAAVLTPPGDVPLLNDGFPVSPELLGGLRPAEPPGGSLHLLRDTGLARLAAGGWHLLADIGPPCPAELPAHAHADTLGCVLHVDGEPLLIDTGTSTYEAGPARDRERSTAAHNTLEVDGRDSTEVWGAFRAGRRARVSGVSADCCEGVLTVAAAHDGYRYLPGRPRHHRRWSLSPDGLRVDDTVTGRGRHRIVVRWHLAAGTHVRLVPGGAVITSRAGRLEVAITGTAGLTVTAGSARAAAGYGATVGVPVLAAALDTELPVRISTDWRRAAPNGEPT
ncbi:MAG TPA: alginate lyase family protein [Trebonia sp.]